MLMNSIGPWALLIKMVQAYINYYILRDLILVLRKPILAHWKIRRKFESMWKLPFIIKRVYNDDSYKLINCNGDYPKLLIIGGYLKKYCV